ncbi:gpW family head-tail joining protein [Caballeronia sp. LZ033]|uniref:gpW family head-tail joining protein n=1 Tax=Caballeronia sp. LZ033 TaxID=3038566 RepID=UPI002860E92C|nr:gpW family head-tail joining protein [Caballeronia sp. LZ033]MDR5813327.1 gpW family head-tail joining protein [Caballeronia sp. LZ033]
MSFDPEQSIFAGMDTAVLQQALADAQQAYIDLSTGAKGESYSYTQGDGAKAVTYTRASLPALYNLIRQLQMILNPNIRSRRPMRPYF